jgi:glutathione peroxidase-family protein
MMTYKIIVTTYLIFQTVLNSIYNINVPLIEGGNQSLSSYQGKKLLIVTLPLQQNPSTDSLLFSLDTMATAHVADLKVIATPSYEDGFTAEQKTYLNNWYRSKLGSNIIISDGLYTRKSSGSLQHPLFSWLTHVAENSRFDIDITEDEIKFFVNTDGKIYGVLRKQTKMWSKVLNRVINTPVQINED